MQDIQQKALVFLLLAVSIAFFAILLPFYSAVFWGAVLAIVFNPLYQRLLGPLRRRNLAALATVALCLVVVILPLGAISASIVQQGAQVYEKVRSGGLDFGAYFQHIIGVLPPWMGRLLDSLGLADMGALQRKLASGAMRTSQFVATQALSIGQNTFQFVISFGVMLYLLFFLLRDGSALLARIKHAIPLSTAHKRHLFVKFTTVVRATVKGNIAVAAAQGLLGGLIFWFLGIPGPLLWGVVMAFLSLLPAIGAGLVWAPVAVYFLATGALWQGVTLIVFGLLVIGMVDNILRPLLVGKDTQMPDYVVLISTIGGMALFGLNGFVIGPVIAALFIAVWDLFASANDASH